MMLASSLLSLEVDVIRDGYKIENGCLKQVISIAGTMNNTLTNFIPYYYFKKTRPVRTHSSGRIHSNSSVSYDVVVVGAGVAGSALAYALAKDGRRVHVIERNLKEPDRIVGEILQPAGYLKLLELGLGDCVKDIDAQKLVGYAFHKDGKSNALHYPLENYNSDVAARAFHHGRFVQKLRQKAASLPNVDIEQGNVTSLIEKNDEIKGVQYTTRKGQQLMAYASLIVVCDGSFSKLRQSLANPKSDQTSYGVGIILENCQIPNANFINLIMGDPISGIFYPISSTECRFGMVMPGPKAPSISNGEMARYLKTVMAPKVPPEMYNAFMSAVNKGDIRMMPVRHMPSAPCLKAGVIIIGDALGMRNPIAAGGMTVALHDVVLLRNLLRHLDLRDSYALTNCAREFYKTHKSMAFTMNVVANSLYEVVFASPAESRKIIQQVCFDYMSLGHTFSKGPLELISGLNLDKGILMLSFQGIGLYTAGSMLQIPSPKRLYTAAQLTLDVASIVVPIIMKEM